MKTTILFSLLTMLFFVNSYAIRPERPGRSATTFNVRIELLDIYGNPYTGSTGLHGYWARNEQTGVQYEANERFGGFENLPAGTYTFGAYPGNWDGAVAKTVTLSESQTGDDGYIVVQLTYWVE